MAAIERVDLLGEILEFLVSTPTPEDIIAFKPSDALQAHASELLEKNRQGTLTTEEQTELDEFARMNYFMSMLKISAHEKLAA